MAREESQQFYIEVERGNVDGYSNLHKFGSNGLIGTAIVPVCTSGFYRTPTTAVSLEIVSDDANDTSAGTGAREVTIQGLDADGNEQTQTVETNGTSAVTINGTWLRVFRMWVSASGSYANQTTPSQLGTITIQESGGGDVWSTIEDLTGFGLGQSQIGVYTIPKGKRGYLLSVNYSVDTNKTVNIYQFKRGGILTTSAPFDTMRLQSVYEGITGNGQFTHITPESYDELTDIGFMAKTGTGTASVSVEFEMLLIDK